MNITDEWRHHAAQLRYIHARLLIHPTQNFGDHMEILTGLAKEFEMEADLRDELGPQGSAGGADQGTTSTSQKGSQCY